MPTPEQITKAARALAQAETARELRKGTLDADDAESFETKRFTALRAQLQANEDAEGSVLHVALSAPPQVPAMPTITDQNIRAIERYSLRKIKRGAGIQVSDDDYAQDDAEDFADRWAALNEKLTRDEQDLLMTTLSGAEVNHALLYTVVSAVLGALAGWAGCALLS